MFANYIKFFKLLTSKTLEIPKQKNAFQFYEAI